MFLLLKYAGDLEVFVPMQAVAHHSSCARLLTCVPALAKLPCHRNYRRTRIAQRWLMPGGTTRTVCCVGAFRTLCTDPLSALHSERPEWHNLVVA